MLTVLYVFDVSFVNNSAVILYYSESVDDVLSALIMSLGFNKTL